MQGTTVDESLDYLINRYKLTNYRGWVNSLYGIDAVSILGWMLHVMEAVTQLSLEPDNVFERGLPIFVENPSDSKISLDLNLNEAITVRPYFVGWNQHIGFDDAGVVWFDGRTNEQVLFSFASKEAEIPLKVGMFVDGRPIDIVVALGQPTLAVILLCLRYPDHLRDIVKKVEGLAAQEEWRLFRNIGFLYGETRDSLHEHMLRNTAVGFYYNTIAKEWGLPLDNRPSLLDRESLLTLDGFGGEEFGIPIKTPWHSLGEDTPAGIATDVVYRDSWSACMQIIEEDVGMSIDLLSLIREAVATFSPILFDGKFCETLAEMYVPENESEMYSPISTSNSPSVRNEPVLTDPHAQSIQDKGSSSPDSPMQVDVTEKVQIASSGQNTTIIEDPREQNTLDADMQANPEDILSKRARSVLKRLSQVNVIQIMN